MSESSESSGELIANLTSEELLVRWKRGDSAAADVLVGRYTTRLVAFVASQISLRVRHSIAPQDIAQSAMGSFFGMIAQSRLRSSRIHSVWSLLVTFAKRKLINTIEKEQSAKRGGRFKRMPFDEGSILDQKQYSATASDVLSELEHLCENDQSISVLSGLLEGKTHTEIATDLGISDRTVRRIVSGLRARITGSNQTDAEKEVETQGQGKYQPKILPKWNYGEFVLRRLIGQGAFGKVYEAITQKDSASIAVKFLKRDFWENSAVRTIFLQEVDKAACVRHPGVVKYLGWGASPHGGPFIIQQYVDADSLSNHKDVDLSQFRSWMLQICDALKAIHTHQITHGDLSPNNILIDRASNDIYLSDFGFSRQFNCQNISESDGHVEQWETSGTLGFISPEQVSSYFGTVGPASDLFALGAIAYWYTTGKPLYANLSAPKAWEALLSESEIDIPFGEPSWLITMMRYCLQKPISRRPKSIEQVKLILKGQ